VHGYDAGLQRATLFQFVAVSSKFSFVALSVSTAAARTCPLACTASPSRSAVQLSHFLILTRSTKERATSSFFSLVALSLFHLPQPFPNSLLSSFSAPLSSLPYPHPHGFLVSSHHDAQSSRLPLPILPFFPLAVFARSPVAVATELVVDARARADEKQPDAVRVGSVNFSMFFISPR
jgi:hypothetical protein